MVESAMGRRPLKENGSVSVDKMALGDTGWWTTSEYLLLYTFALTL